MRDYLGQIRAALACNLYYLALSACLTIPDICGALSSENGRATRERYIAWYDEYMRENYTSPNLIEGGERYIFTGLDCYTFRCSFLHQGSNYPHQGGQYSRVIFVEPGATTNVFHPNSFSGADGLVLNIDVSVFCDDMLAAVDTWLVTAEQTAHYQRNYPRFVQRYPDGLKPYIGGVAVIA